MDNFSSIVNEAVAELATATNNASRHEAARRAIRRVYDRCAELAESYPAYTANHGPLVNTTSKNIAGMLRNERPRLATRRVINGPMVRHHR